MTAQATEGQEDALFKYEGFEHLEEVAQVSDLLFIEGEFLFDEFRRGGCLRHRRDLPENATCGKRMNPTQVVANCKQLLHSSNHLSRT